VDKALFVDVVAKLYQEKAKAGKLAFKNNFYLERGYYDLISVLDENEDATPYIRDGKLIDLFDPALPVLTRKEVKPGEQAYLVNLSRVSNPEKPQILASASRNYVERITQNSYTFTAKSPLNTTNAMRILLPAEPKEYKATNKQGEAIEVRYSWDSNTNTCFLGFENHPDGINVDLKWQEKI
jgi:hypothetical protein